MTQPAAEEFFLNDTGLEYSMISINEAEQNPIKIMNNLAKEGWRVLQLLPPHDGNWCRYRILIERKRP